MNFRDALDNVIADLTPQPWEYTSADGTTLTVIPAGLPEDRGSAEVNVRITALAQFDAVEAGVPSRDLPAMIDALTGNQLWSYTTLDDVEAQLVPFGGGGMLLALSVDLEADDEPQIHIPEAQRLPLASALQRALDVARGWES